MYSAGAFKGSSSAATTPPTSSNLNKNTFVDPTGGIETSMGF
jgi:hypothetical protein